MMITLPMSFNAHHRLLDRLTEPFSHLGYVSVSQSMSVMLEKYVGPVAT